MILAGPFAAPMFMICMGIGICYSRNQDWQSLVKRGVRIVFMGYVLNIVRYVLPQCITTFLTGESRYMANWVSKLCEVDILQFAGLSFIAIGLARKFRLSNCLLTVIACILSITGCILKDVNTGAAIPDLLLGLFWKTQEHAYFTFFHWFIFPVMGMILGDLLLRCRDKKKTYKKIIPVLLPIGVAAELTAIALGKGLLGDFTEYYYMTVVDVFFLVSLAIAWAGFLFLVYEKFPKGMIVAFQNMSKNINQIYCIHWGMIGILGIVRVFTWKDTVVSMLPMTMVSFAVLFIAAVIADGYQKWKRITYVQRGKGKAYGN